MSFQGFGNEYGVETVDEVADYTNMQGQASELNVAASEKGAWRQSPTKSLLALWFFALIVYFLVIYFFRRYTTS